jgi:predicted RNA binding protein YcfA (HicA-like mRNA interferase family)
MPSKDLRQLISSATKQGWVVSRTNGSHLKWKPPRGKFVISAYSPSDPRAIKNIRKELERQGFTASK